MTDDIANRNAKRMLLAVAGMSTVDRERNPHPWERQCAAIECPAGHSIRLEAKPGTNALVTKIVEGWCGACGSALVDGTWVGCEPAPTIGPQAQQCRHEEVREQQGVRWCEECGGVRFPGEEGRWLIPAWSAARFFG